MDSAPNTSWSSRAVGFSSSTHTVPLKRAGSWGMRTMNRVV
jgi:hypothetical protein